MSYECCCLCYVFTQQMQLLCWQKGYNILKIIIINFINVILIIQKNNYATAYNQLIFSTTTVQTMNNALSSVITKLIIVAYTHRDTVFSNAW